MISTQISDYCVCSKIEGRHGVANLILSGIEFSHCFETGTNDEAQTNVALTAADQMTGLWSKTHEKQIDNVVQFPTVDAGDATS